MLTLSVAVATVSVNILTLCVVVDTVLVNMLALRVAVATVAVATKGCSCNLKTKRCVAPLVSTR